MSLPKTTLRQQFVINRLRNRPQTWKEISQALENRFEIDGIDLRVNQRTFQRDIDTIFSTYRIEILNDRSTNKYYIAYEDPEYIRELEALDVINLLKIGGNKHPAVSFEQRRPRGTEHLYPLLRAINTGKAVKFQHHKFYEAESQERIVNPYLLKEFKGRWYLVSHDRKKDELRIFGLDRISQLEIVKRSFKVPSTKKIEGFFKHSFGIILPDAGADVEEIILSFTPHQGQYLLTHPLHASQEIIEQNDREIRLKLQLYVTHDLVLELLSHGNQVKIIQPEILKKLMREVTYKG